jgi:hypothetical protein
MSCSVGRAQTAIPLQLTTISLATTTDATQVGYLLIDMPKVEVPRDMRLDESYIEFFMDVSTTRNADSPTNELVSLEIYPFGGANAGRLDVSRLGSSSMKRTVRVGQSRPVRIYVTEFVARTIDDSAVDRRLIVGAVSGKRYGRFDARSLENSQAKAILTVTFSRIEEAAARSR